MATAASMAGQYHLYPGQSLAIHGRRPVLQPGRLRQLLAGQTPAQAVSTLGNVFTLCAHAHQRSARQALAAAQRSLTDHGSCATSFNDPPALLLLETARDHLRSIALDWPQRLGLAQAPAAQLAWLKGCPLPVVAPTPVSDEALAWRLLAQLNDWLANRVLQQASDAWLAQHRAPDALAAWCHTHARDLLPARCLDDGLQHSTALAQSAPALSLLDQNPARQQDRLLALVRQMQHEPDFCQYPTWHGQSAENGPWTRLRHATTPTTSATLPAVPPVTPPLAPVATQSTLEQRLASRWFELLELSQTTPESLAQGPAPLRSGVLVTGPGQALAWCEMARGLLLHWAHCAADGSVIDYKVIAPTEWNFHPQGTLGQALAVLSSTDSDTARRLAAVFDPCVVCTV
ncbi:MAG: hypothetical protein AUJ20_02100 [Comamonadaceae bacterium CG1_02_60_18]|nr:MAG: hypothetical protein AUJ20_02100 [Comamonadaceae bacterium CG1_02_60_18]PIQ53987.1 MAG: hypothetical protein COW02_05660 [Comamonadaceae bacterium CG12_big_fil_rev_8_21_14_0_65_59_15]